MHISFLLLAWQHPLWKIYATYRTILHQSFDQKFIILLRSFVKKICALGHIRQYLEKCEGAVELLIFIQIHVKEKNKYPPLLQLVQAFWFLLDSRIITVTLILRDA
jgi:hypothetical protein